MSGKGEVQMSDWSLPQPLSAEQLEYAGNDAFAAVILHEAMSSRLDAGWREMLTPSTSSLTKKRKAKGDPGVQNPTAANPEEKKARARAQRIRRNDKEFSKLTPELQILYEILKTRSSELIEYILPHYAIFKIVNCTPLPTTIEGFEVLAVLKGTNREFIYEFVNALRRFAVLEELVEPEGWREYFIEERRAMEMEKEDKEMERLKET